jgi:recombination protein RecT
MANELATIEKQLDLYRPKFADVLRGSPIAPARLMRTVLVSCERTPRLLECSRSSLLSSAMTAAVLQLECDSILGQGYIIPYNVKGTLTAQFQLGYKGLGTLAARSGFIISAGIYREGDDWHYVQGSAPRLEHFPSLTGAKDRRILAAYAVARSNALPSIFSVLPIDDVMAIKNKSQGAKKPDSPWNDPAVGFPAMAEKSARRRLARSMPLNADTRLLHLAAGLDEATEERGLPAYVEPERGLVVDGQAETLTDGPQPAQVDLTTFRIHYVDGTHADAPTPGKWCEVVRRALALAPDRGRLDAFWQANAQALHMVQQIDPDGALEVVAAYNERIR